MAEYSELIERLKTRASWINFPHHGEEYPTEDAKLMYDAADAIENLSMIKFGNEAAIFGMKREIERMVVINADRVPVVHGKWIDSQEKGEYGEDIYGWRCSSCHRLQEYSSWFNYCPNCGAWMDGE